MKRTIALLLAVILCLGLCACGGSNGSATTSSPQSQTQSPEEAEAEAAAEAAFQESMGLLMENPNPEAITGDKAVVMLYDESKDLYGHFTQETVPESLRTGDAGQVRYIIRRTEDVDYVGYYTGGGAALQQVYTVDIFDLQRNLILGTKNFRGGEPPSVLKEGDSNVGTPPDEEPITAWILETIAGEPGEDCPELFVTIHIRVPEQWGVPYLEFIDPYKYHPEYGVVRYVREARLEGDWYVLTQPGWIENWCVATDPTLLGEEGYYSSELIEGSIDRDIWITVEDLEGNLSRSYQEPGI